MSDRASEGEFDAFVRAQLPRLVRYAVMLTGDPELAQDLVQDVMIKAHGHWSRVRAADRPDRYVTTMVTNAYLSWRRRWSVRHIVVMADVPEMAAAETDAVDRADLWQRLAGLPRSQRAALVLRYYEGARVNTTDLLVAVFTEHEVDAPDVSQTRLAIEAELARTSRRRTGAILAVAAAVVAIATASAVIAAGRSAPVPAPQSAAGPRPSQSESSLPPRPVTPPAGVRFPFRPGWLPPGARLDHVETGLDGMRLAGYTFGATPSNERGLTLWSGAGPLPDRLRDGGTLRRTTINGSPAVEGWSPSSRSYTVSILRPGDLVLTVLAYGWDEPTVTSFATYTAQHLRYGDFPAPGS